MFAAPFSGMRAPKNDNVRHMEGIAHENGKASIRSVHGSSGRHWMQRRREHVILRPCSNAVSFAFALSVPDPDAHTDSGGPVPEL